MVGGFVYMLIFLLNLLWELAKVANISRENLKNYYLKCRNCLGEKLTKNNKV